eukprot:Phypoly_transcript_01117.p1 GENE.Phypoly_transcript_01117~~Phypoly_transcript_01117.p1  ORF type:complete len:1145 (-),score=223.33 Phypoly_transcript_01117:232-3237(-)
MTEALQVFARMKRRIEPDVHAYNVLIKGFGKLGMFDKAETIFNSMVEKNLKPDERTFSILVHIFGTAKNFQKAEFYLSEALSLGYKDPHIFSTLLGCYAKIDDIEKAENTLARMKSHGVKPTTVTYNSLLSMYTRAHNPQKVDELYHLLKEETNPDIATFTTMLDFYKQENRMEDMCKTLLQMSQMGLTPTFTKYSDAINGLISEGKHDEALQTITRLLEITDLRPDLAMVNQIGNAYVQTEQVTKIADLWKCVRESGHTFFNSLNPILLQAFLKVASDAREWKEVGELIRVMKEQKLIDPDLLRKFEAAIEEQKKPPPPPLPPSPSPSLHSHPPPSQPTQQSPQILAREDKYKETDPMKKLEGALDSQIKALLKRAKLYLEHSQVASVITGLPLFSIEPSFGIARLAHQSHDATPVDIFSLFANASSSGGAAPDSSPDVNSDDRSVIQLVLQQVKLLLGPQGLPGRRAEYITIRVWQTAANTLQELLLAGPAPRRGPPGAPTTPPPAAKTRTDPTEKLLAFLDPDYKFSASRCATALLSAREQYLTGLPAHYTAQVHEKQLLRASAAFAQQARGPAAPYYTSKLRDDCAKIWVQGRHICDAVSLTGRPCVYLVEGSENGATHPGPHSSGFHTLCTCNCGKSRRTREDPFDLESANYLFFTLFPDCCKSSISLDLPAKSPQWSLECLGTGTSYQPILGLQQEGFVQNRNFLSLVHFGGAPWLTTSKMGLGHVIRHARQMRQEHHHSSSHPSELHSPQANVAYYGYEYECPTGHRFFLEAPKDVNTALAAAAGGGGGGILNLGNAGVEALPKPTPNRSRSRSSRNRHKHVNPSVTEAGARPTTPAHETATREHEHRAMFTLCVACGSLAQLQRIFLVTPDWAGSFTINPKVVFHVAPPPPQPTQARPGGGILPTPTASPSMPSSMSLAAAPTEKYEFSLGMEILLPKNAMVCLRLPYIYTKPGPNNKPVPLLQVAPNLPYIATASLGLHIPHMHAHFPQTRE